MSYDNQTRASVLGSFDIQAIQAIYGTNQQDGKQDASWSWNASTETLIQTGTAAAQLMRGTGANDIVYGMGGHDAIVTDGGDDIIYINGGAACIRGRSCLWIVHVTNNKISFRLGKECNRNE